MDVFVGRIAPPCVPCVLALCREVKEERPVVVFLGWLFCGRLIPRLAFVRHARCPAPFASPSRMGRCKRTCKPTVKRKRLWRLQRFHSAERSPNFELTQPPVANSGSGGAWALLSAGISPGYFAFAADVPGGHCLSRANSSPQRALTLQKAMPRRRDESALGPNSSCPPGRGACGRRWQSARAQVFLDGEILDRAVVSTEIVDILAAAGITTPDISILSDEFLAEVQQLEKKNLALEALRKLLNDEIRSRSKTNVVETNRFSERLEAAIARYHTNAISTVEVLQELIDLAKDVRAARRPGRG